jgi:hypothetical protein
MVRGRNYLYDGGDQSMRNFNLAYAPNGSFENNAPDWDPAPAPVNIEFVQSNVFGGSGFPASKQGHAFITLSGPTHARGPNFAKSIQEWVFNDNGTRRVSAAGQPANPRELASYEGSGYSTAAGIAAGPDGLYFSTLYPDVDANATNVGAKIFRIVYIGAADFTADKTAGPLPLTVKFTDASDVPNPTAYLWDFGDGQTSTERNPTHTYATDGFFTVKLTVTGDGGPSTISKNRFITAGNPPPPPGGGGTGLSATYYNNINFTGTTIRRIDPTVNFDFGTGSPHPSIGADTFSVRWIGQVQPGYSETYTFHTLSDDGVRLIVNGQTIIDNFTDHAPTDDFGSIALVAGQKYDIRMEFYENGGGAVARLFWASDSVEEEIVPQDRLFPATTPAVRATAVAVPPRAGGSVFVTEMRIVDDVLDPARLDTEFAPERNDSSEPGD